MFRWTATATIYAGAGVHFAGLWHGYEQLPGSDPPLYGQIPHPRTDAAGARGGEPVPERSWRKDTMPFSLKMQRRGNLYALAVQEIQKTIRVYLPEMARMDYLRLIIEKYKEATKGFKDEWFQKADHSWYNNVMNLPESLKVTYTVMILDDQISNGGFHQYFVNGYGQFAKDTIGFLLKLGAEKKADLLGRALAIVNPENFDDQAFREKILRKELYELIEGDSLFDPLNTLDKAYYKDEEVDELKKRLGSYLYNLQDE